MNDTRAKLLEAKYFLERMKEMQSERDAFRYNLSAFLSAARSVTLIMQVEFDKVSGFRQWYAEKQTWMKSDQVMTLFNEKRTMTIHERSVNPHARIGIGISDTFCLGDSTSIDIIHADGTIERGELEPVPSHKLAQSESTQELRWYFDELPDKDVVSVCEEHLVKLDTLVAECESQFFQS